MTRISDETRRKVVRAHIQDGRTLVYAYRFETAAERIMPFQSFLTIGTIRYAHTRITDI